MPGITRGSDHHHVDALDQTCAPQAFLPNLPYALVLALALIWGLTDMLPGYAQEVPIVPYLSTGCRYLVVDQGEGPANFYTVGFDDLGWAMGDAAFGQGLNIPGFSLCPLDPTDRTQWPTDTDILLRKTFTLRANEQCMFTYGGPQLPGADLIAAYADENDDNMQQANEPADTATKA